MSIDGYETAKEAAARLGVSDSRIRQLAGDGKLPGAFKVAGSVWLIPEGAGYEKARSGRKAKGLTRAS